MRIEIGKWDAGCWRIHGYLLLLIKATIIATYKLKPGIE